MSRETGKGGIGSAVVVVAAVAALAVIVFRFNKSAERARLEREAEKEQQLLHERMLREERERKEAELEAQERELRRKRLEREEEQLRILADRKKRDAGRKNGESGFGADCADAHRAALALFAVPARFSQELPKGAKKDEFFCIFGSYRDDRLVYKVENRPGAEMKVIGISPSAAPSECDAAAFKSRMRKEPFAAAIDGGVWIYGVPFPSGKAFPVPPRGRDFSLYDAVFGETFVAALVVAGVQPPEIQFDCQLRQTDGDGKPFFIGKTGFDRPLERQRMESAVLDILKKLQAKQLRASDEKAARIKREFERKKKALGKPYAPKYVLYDGTCDDMIFKQSDGAKEVPKMVPRVFKFKSYTLDFILANPSIIAPAERRWRELHHKAVEEEKKARKSKAAFAKKLARLEAEMKSELAKAASTIDLSSDENVDAELAKRELLITEISTPR